MWASFCLRRCGDALLPAEFDVREEGGSTSFFSMEGWMCGRRKSFAFLSRRPRQP